MIERLGYAGIAALTFLENVLPPIPSEVVIPLAGFVSAQGILRLDIVIVAATVGSLAGTTAWYALGRHVGEARLQHWVARHGRWITLSPRDLQRADVWFRSHGAWAVCLGRMVPGVRTLISLPAGFTAMPLTRFLLDSTIGTVAWTGRLAGAGMILQANFERVRNYIDIVSNVLLALFVAVLAVRYVRCWRDSESPTSRSAWIVFCIHIRQEDTYAWYSCVVFGVSGIFYRGNGRNAGAGATIAPGVQGGVSLDPDQFYFGGHVETSHSSIACDSGRASMSA